MNYPSTSFDPVRVAAALGSGDPQRVRDALATLDEAWRQREFAPLPFPEPDLLAATFPDGAPKDVVEKYLGVLENYPDFEPTPSSSQVRHAMLEAVVRSGHVSLAYNVVLLARIDPGPDLAASDLVGHLRDINIETPQEIAVALQVVDLLLDATTTRLATVQMLRIWVMTDRFPEIVEAVKRRMTPEEIAYITAD